LQDWVVDVFIDYQAAIDRHVVVVLTLIIKSLAPKKKNQV